MLMTANLQERKYDQYFHLRIGGGGNIYEIWDGILV